jgi:ABC-2 type transport system permease protein
VILNLQDLIEVKQSSTGTDVQLKNLEYNLTAAVKKAVYGFQSVDSVLATLEKPVVFTLFVSQSFLPENEKEIITLVDKVASEIQQKSNGKFVYQTIDPDVQGAAVTRQQLIEQYGINPYPVSIFSQDSYFFHMILQNGDKTEVVYPPTEANEADIRTGIESSLKRSTSGFLKVIGYWAPPQTATQDAFGQTVQPISSYNLLAQQIQQDYELVSVDLTSGRIQDNIDTMVILAPQDLSETELFAIDQFLMRGGSLIIAISPYKLDSDQFSGFLTLTPVVNNGLELLKQYGVNIQSELVMDSQNAAFPVVTQRDVGGTPIQEIQSVQYPFFIDVRPESMDSKNMIVSNLPTVSFNWASPLNLDSAKNEGRETSVLLSSSPNSWLTTSTNIQPDFQTYPQTGFAAGETLQSYPLAVAIQGSFESYFKEKPLSPNADAQTEQSTGNIITQSPPNTRLVVFASTGFIDDFALQLSSRLTQDYYINNMLLVQNAVDWTVEDIDLLSIRSRGSATRVLIPLTDQQRTGWEGGIYIVEVLLLIGVYAFWRAQQRKNLSSDLLIFTSDFLEKEDSDD